MTMIQETFPLSIGGDQVATEDKLLTDIEPGMFMSPDPSVILLFTAPPRVRTVTTPQSN